MARPSNFSREADTLRGILEEAYEQAEKLLEAAGNSATKDPLLSPHYRTLPRAIKDAQNKLAFLERLDKEKNTPVYIIDKETGKLYRGSRDDIIKIARDYDTEEAELL